jgi:hypothetical protein
MSVDSALFQRWLDDYLIDPRIKFFLKARNDGTEIVRDAAVGARTISSV